MRYAYPLRAVAITVPVLLAALTAPALAQSAGGQAAGLLARSTPGDRAASDRGALTPGQARLLSRNDTDKVIVVLRNQVAGIPDTASDAARRTAAVDSLQAGVMAQLSAAHARSVRGISLVNAVAATVSPGEASLLAASPAVAEVIPDQPIPLAPEPALPGRPQAASSQQLPPGTCPPRGQVQLDPEAIENIHAATQSGKGNSAQSLGYTGARVKVAYIADGVDPDNPDFIRADGQHVFVDDKDFTGVGTSAQTFGEEAFIDASSIAAQGRHAYNLASYVFGLSVPCRIRVLGVAPGAGLVGLEGFSLVAAYGSEYLEAISYAVTVDHVNIINESFGSNTFPDTASLDVTKMANDAAVRAGVTVTVSSGDAGRANTIGSPATDPNVISVGGTTTYRFYPQEGLSPPGIKGWIDNNISGGSSGGVDQDGSTVDVVAPGDSNWALCTPDPAKFGVCGFAKKPAPVQPAGGTSESAPLTAGVAALVIQAYARTHRGRDPSPAIVKRIIMSTAQDIGAPGDQQGAGMVDAYQAVLAAASYPGSTAEPAGHAVLDSATQLHAAGQPGISKHFTETLTNDGDGSLTVGLSSRTLGQYRAASAQTLRLTAAHDYSQAVRFRVHGGQARLNVSAALSGGASLALISPDGDLAESNITENSNFSYAEVADPAPGMWTADLSAEITVPTPPSEVTAHFQASTATWRRLGRLSARSLTLPPRASRSFSLTVSTPARPGDRAGSVILRSSARTPAFAAVTSVPVILRSLVPAPNPSVTFTGTLTGGLGLPDIGQAAYYQLDLPAGRKALNAQVSTANSANHLFAELVSPAGQAVSTAINGLLVITPAGKTETAPETGAQLHVLNPGPGRWTLIVDFYDSVSGTAVSQPFTATINDVPVQASAAGLPDSPRTHLAPGQPVTIRLRVTNSGSTPEAYFVDARLSSQKTVGLAAQSISTLKVPFPFGKQPPTYLVPSHTTSMTAAASSPVPLYFDLSWAFGDPDLISSVGSTATRTYSAPQVADGDWILTPILSGPFGPRAAKPVRASVSMTATTAAFDPAVSSPTGDLWLGSISSRAGFTPYVADPGQSITIPVTITPHGTAGTKVTGTVYLDDSSLAPGELDYQFSALSLPQASDLAAFRYSYTIR